MTTANKLTILRVLMIPAFLVVLYWGFPGSRYVALGIYIVALSLIHISEPTRP